MYNIIQNHENLVGLWNAPLPTSNLALIYIVYTLYTHTHTKKIFNGAKERLYTTHPSADVYLVYYKDQRERGEWGRCILKCACMYVYGFLKGEPKGCARGLTALVCDAGFTGTHKKKGERER